MDRFRRGLVALAGLMGASGVALAAASAHGGDAALLAPASSMLLFHASAVIGSVALAARGIVQPGLAIIAAAGFIVAAALFSGDLALRHFAGHGLFPFAPPIGGTLLIVSWLALGVAGLWPRRT
jgi:uncharacterized membrane protein YgdD (TMEM256/DUF423 family)